MSPNTVLTLPNREHSEEKKLWARHTLKRLLVAAGAVVAVGVLVIAVTLILRAPDGSVVFESDTLRIRAFAIAGANVFVVDRNGKRLMIDAGNPGDGPAYEALMRERGISPESIDYLILTHGHIDHAGTAAFFQSSWGIKVVGGRRDQPMIDAGGRDDVCPTDLVARLILWVGGDRTYPRFDLDRPLDGDFDLIELGIEGKILRWPGHTPGSLVVVFDNQVFVGDLVRGGMLDPEQPATHFFMCDLVGNRGKIRELLSRTELSRWYPGHLGPLDADAVRSFAADLPNP